MLEKVLAGSHVFIDDWGNFFSVYLNFLPQDLRCKFRASKFHFSKTPVTVQPAGWLINKKLPKEMKEMINLRLMWLHATGLLISPHLATDETGIISSKVIEEDCPRVKVSAEQVCPELEAEGPRPLSLFQLKNAFIGLAVGYLVSLLAFACECLSVKVRIPSLVLRLSGDPSDIKRPCKAWSSVEPSCKKISFGGREGFYPILPGKNCIILACVSVDVFLQQNLASISSQTRLGS